jgi:hypothetical protein
MIRVQYHTAHNKRNTRILKVPCAKHESGITPKILINPYPANVDYTVSSS